nr:MAG TPA: hypothetical protein [Caudoviricetes sp.]
MKKWKPSDYFLMGEHEKMVTRLFLEREIKERAKEYGD